jgi:hypothetical protein
LQVEQLEKRLEQGVQVIAVASVICELAVQLSAQELLPTTEYLPELQTEQEEALVQVSQPYEHAVQVPEVRKYPELQPVQFEAT